MLAGRPLLHWPVELVGPLIDFGASTGPERPTSIVLAASTLPERPTSIDFGASTGPERPTSIDLGASM